MANKKITVIVPAYNEEKHLEECLLSIKNQTYHPIELIVVDDGSTDKTAVVSKKYADVFIQQKHQGPAVARNKAVKAAKGKILVFIDADMYLDINYIKKIIAPILAEKSQVTFTKEEYVANKDNIWSQCFQIDNNLPMNKRIRPSQGNISNRFRAITKKRFLRTNGYLVKRGYGEDEVLQASEAVVAPGAICYHYNPDSLKDVFLSARWVGRSTLMTQNLKNFLRYSILNSIVISLKKIYNGSPASFFIYKIVFDLGVMNGILLKKLGSNHSK